MRPACVTGLALAVALAGCLDFAFEEPPIDVPVAPTPTPPDAVPSTPPPSPTPAPPARDPALRLEPAFAGLAAPVHLAHAGDDRVFIVEQAGRIRVAREGELAPEPFLDITPLVRSGGEQGLLSVAFDPRFAENGRLYVHYTDLEGDTVVARYEAKAGRERADASTARVLLAVDQPFSNHNGGLLLFGPDGMLYVFLGDGGAAGDPQNRAQDLEDRLGKILRLDVTGDAPVAPADNPFVGKPGRDEIWAYGLRNPWRASFDRATGDLWIGDVGQGTEEEVNFQPRASPGGENYGWRVWEGTHRYKADESIDGEHTRPVATYGTHDEGGCAVTGGVVYRGPAAPSLVGTYLFADYCNGKVWGMRGPEGEPVELADTDLRITSFGEDARGNVFVVDHGGTVSRVVDG